MPDDEKDLQIKRMVQRIMENEDLRTAVIEKLKAHDPKDDNDEQKALHNTFLKSQMLAGDFRVNKKK